MITFNNVTKYYNDKIALNNLNFKINDGEIFGIIGESGAGKSTLIRTINQIEPISSGTIKIDETNIASCTRNELNKIRNEIGFIFQDFNLLENLNISQNIALPLKNIQLDKKKIKDKVSELLKVVGLENFENKYIHQLSGGQKQRVAIARALALNPKILLCDEATSALDPQTTKQILQLLTEINKNYNITIVVVTHEMEVIKAICDKVIVLNEGEIVDSGTVLEVFSNPKSAITSDLLETLFSENTQIITNEKHQNTYVIQFNYQGDALDNHGLSRLTKSFNIDFNIIGGQIIDTKQGKYGRLYVEFSQMKNEVEAYLKQNRINYEVI